MKTIPPNPMVESLLADLKRANAKKEDLLQVIAVLQEQVAELQEMQENYTACARAYARFKIEVENFKRALALGRN